MVIAEIDTEQYADIWQRNFSPLVAYYAEQGAKGKFVALAALHEGNVIGVLFAKRNGATIVVKHIAVTLIWRRKGVAKQLICEALQNFWHQGVTVVEAEIPEEKSSSTVNILLSLGFREVRANITIVNQVNKQTRTEFKDYYEMSGHRLEERLLSRGFCIRSFSEATAEELDRLRAQIGQRYPAYLNPFPADKQVVEAGSFIVTKTDDVVGYLALTLFPGRDSIAEVSCRACADEYQNTGVGIWPLLRTLLFVAKTPDRFDKVLFSIDATDKKLTNMIGKMPVSFVGSHTKKLVTYCLERPE